MAQLPALLGLAPEILTLIIDNIHEHYCTESLKALRQTCHQLACSSIIHERLFIKVRLHHSSESIKKVQELDFGRFAPYVQEVKFFPSNYSARMTRDVFEEIVNWQYLHDVLKDQYDSKWSEVTNILTRKDDVQKVIKEHFNGNSPFFSSDDIDHGYEAYQRLTHAIEDQLIEDVWKELLKKMKKCTKISISQEDGAADETKEDDERHCRVHFPHPHHWQHHSDEVCRNLYASTGDPLFATVLKVLAHSQLKLRSFEIDHYSDGAFRWDNIRNFTDLDLSELETLSFYSHWCLISQECPEEDKPIAAADTLAIFQKRCSSTLKLLDLSPQDDDSSLYFPGEVNMVELPALTRLCLGPQSIHLSNFAQFLLLQENLQNLDMASTRAIMDTGRWREIWDAIRNHSSRMKLEFEQVVCNDAAELSCSHWTGEESNEGANKDVDIDLDDSDFSDSESVDSETESAAWEDIYRSFENYVSDKGPWNRSMRSWFD